MFWLSRTKLPVRSPSVLAANLTVSVEPLALVSVPPTAGLVVSHVAEVEATCHGAPEVPASVTTLMPMLLASLATF